MLQPLPTTNDNEFWLDDSYKKTVDTTKLKNELCNPCTFTLLSNERKLLCKECGLVRFFRGGDITEKDDKYFLNGKEILIKK